MALPNINSVRQAGVDPLEIRKQQDRDQKIAEILDNVQSRLSNITNMRSNVQTATFEAFGNNFISRTMSQTMDSAMDSFSRLLIGKKEEKDPALDNAKEQTRLLGVLLSVANDSNSTMNQLDDSVINIRRDLKSFFLKSSDSNKGLSDANGSGTSPNTPIAPSSGVPMIEPFPEIVPPPIKTRPLELENNPSPTLQMPLSPERVIIGQPVENTPPPASVKEPGSQSGKPVHEMHEPHIEKVLDDMLNVMTHTNENIERLLAIVPISNQESDLEKQRRNEPDLKSKVQDKQSVEDAPPPGSNKFDWSRLITGWFDMDANIRGINNIIKMITGTLGKIASILPKTLGSLIPTLSTIGTIAAAAAPLAIMYGVTQWAENASITDEKGELTTTGKVLDAAQQAVGNKSIKPQTEVMSKIGQIEENADTGFLGLFSGPKEYHKKRYQELIDRQQTFSKEESDALKKHFDLTVPEKQVTQSAAIVEISKNTSDKTKLLDDKQKQLNESKESEKSREKVSVNNTSVVNNQTIMPTRTSTKNMDDSYNRYISRALA